jgi:hypothetical protein
VERSSEGPAEIDSKSTAKGKDSGMTLKGKKNEILELHASPIRLHSEDTSVNERGGLSGRELADWLQAEAQLGKNAHLLRTTKGTKQEE